MAVLAAKAVAVLCAALDVEYQAIREQIPGPLTEVEERGTAYEVAALLTANAAWKAVLVLTGRDNTPAAVQAGRAIAVIAAAKGTGSSPPIHQIRTTKTFPL